MVAKSKADTRAPSRPERQPAQPAMPRASSASKTSARGGSRSPSPAPASLDQRTIRRITRNVSPSGEEESDEGTGEGDSGSEGEENSQSESDGIDEGFEVQSSSDESDIASTESADEEGIVRKAEHARRSWREQLVGKARSTAIEAAKRSGDMQAQQLLHVDDLSSDDEEAENTIGRVPLHWYDAFDHVGYDIQGQRIAKRTGKDRIDLALEHADPLAQRRVYDMYNDKEVVLSERDLEIIRRIQANAFAHPEFNDTPDYVDYFSSIKEDMPLTAVPTPKASFLPSKWEMLKIKQIMAAMKDGTFVAYKDRKAKQKSAASAPDTSYLLWPEGQEEVQTHGRNMFHLPAPKMPLPGHAESYNPPAEYLLNEEEKEQLAQLDAEDRPLNFIPSKYAALRHVPAYENFVKERYERCMDLYLCPRKLKKRLNIDPESLLPKLPHPRDLRPFPNSLCMQYLGHSKAVRCLAASPDGQYLASADMGGEVRLWEVATGFCRSTWSLSAAVTAMAWNPQQQHALLAVATGTRVVFISTATGDQSCTEITEALLAAALDESASLPVQHEDAAGESGEDEDADDREKASAAAGEHRGKKHVTVQWRKRSDAVFLAGRKTYLGPRCELTLSHPVASLAWHHKGDYFVVCMPSASSASVSVHQLSKAKAQFPFSKSPGKVCGAMFHPSLPCLVVMTQQHVKVFHLVEQRLVKKLQTGCKWLSCVDVHPSGDHILVGSYDRRVAWFDLDLSSTPYKTLKFHEKAVRAVQFHRNYPLFASAADDGSIHVFHATVYSDLMRNPLLVPLKVIKEHGVAGELGVLGLAFHPKQPWLFSSGADGVINLYQDL